MIDLGVCLATALFCTGLDGHDEEAPSGLASDCGSRSLYLILKLEGHDADLDQIDTALSSLPAEGRQLKELREAARRCGMALFGVRLTDREGALDRPALVYLDRRPHGHFVVVRPVGHTGRRIQLLDPNESPVVLDAAILFNRPDWTGIALVPRRPMSWLTAIAWGMAATLPVAAVCTLRRCRRLHARRRVRSVPE